MALLLGVPVWLELGVPVWLLVGVPVGVEVDVGVEVGVDVGEHCTSRSFISTPPYCSDDWNCATFSYTALQWPLAENSACWASPTAGMYCVTPGPNVLLRLKMRCRVKGVSRVSTLPHEQYGGTLHAAAIVPVHTSAVP